MGIDPIVVIAASLLFSYVMMDAGLHKLRKPRHFAAIIDDYRVLPWRPRAVLAAALGALETAAAVAVLLPVTHAFTAAIVALLLFVYLLVIGINLLRGRRTIDCGCGGPAHGRGLSTWLLLRNGVLIALALALAAAKDSGVSVWLDWLVAFAAAGTFILLYAIGNQMLSNQQLLREF